MLPLESWNWNLPKTNRYKFDLPQNSYVIGIQYLDKKLKSQFNNFYSDPVFRFLSTTDCQSFFPALLFSLQLIDLSQFSISYPLIQFQCKFPQVSVIVEPPSPVLTEQIRSERLEHIRIEIEGEPDPDIDLLCSKEDKLSTNDITSNNSSNSNLLGIGPETFMSRSPAATRRISCCSMLNAAETAALAAAAATSKFYSEMEKKELDKKDEKQNRKMPIINPLVTLPQWPSKHFLIY